MMQTDTRARSHYIAHLGEFIYYHIVINHLKDELTKLQLNEWMMEVFCCKILYKFSLIWCNTISYSIQICELIDLFFFLFSLEYNRLECCCDRHFVRSLPFELIIIYLLRTVYRETVTHLAYLVFNFTFTWYQTLWFVC